MELWRTDGTAVGTKLVKDLASERWLGVRSATGSYPKDFMQINEQVYFVAQGPEGGPAWSLWGVDGDTVHEVQTLPFTSNGDIPHQDVTFSVTDAPGGFFQFLVQNGSNQTAFPSALLYQSDGTSEGTTVYKRGHYHQRPAFWDISFLMALTHHELYHPHTGMLGWSINADSGHSGV